MQTQRASRNTHSHMHVQSFLSGSDDKTVKVFDTRTGVCVSSIPFSGAVGALQRKVRIAIEEKGIITHDNSPCT